MAKMRLKPAARDLSFAPSADTRAGKAVIRVMETATGRSALIKRARGFETELAQGASIFDVMAARYGISLDILGGTLANVPRDGPLIVVANHPYGILDGLMMGHLLARARTDFRILANSVFMRAPGAAQFVLPVNFDGTRDAVAQNVATRRKALAFLRQGGAIGVFPGGTISTGARPFARPMDPVWRGFTARMIVKSGAAALPVYFDGHTSRAFQIASHLHQTLRMGLMIREFRIRLGMPVRVVIGTPFDPADLAPWTGDAKGMMDFLRKATYELAPEPLDSFAAGYEFEDRRRSR